jgi:thiol-disulfide isomerase/thioredoxin
VTGQPADGGPTRGAGRGPGFSRLRGLGWPGKIAMVAVPLIGLLVIIAWLAGGSSAGTPAKPLAKNFTLAELGHPGRQISLAAYHGRPVIINFFASWCPPCKRETPVLARFYDDHHGNVIIVGIDINDQAKSAIRFVRAAGVHYLVGFDPEPAQTFTAGYGVQALPQTFFLDARHRIVRHLFGPVTMKQLTAGLAAMGGSPPSEQDRG